MTGTSTRTLAGFATAVAGLGEMRAESSVYSLQEYKIDLVSIGASRLWYNTRHDTAYHITCGGGVPCGVRLL